MKRRVLAMFLACVMALGLLAGCGGNDSDAPGSSGGSNGGSNASTPSGGSGEATDITLKVWCPTNQIETGIMDEQQKAFQEAHPEWNITWDTTAKVDGSLYAIPFTHNTFFMFYDKTLLSEDDIKSLESIMAAETADNVYNFYFESAGGWKLGCYYYGAGLSVFGADGSDLSAGVDWNNATGLAVTNYLIDLIGNPKCAYDGEIAVSELIADHRLGAWFDGSWNYDLYHDALGDDLGLAVIPTFNPDGTDRQLLGFYSSKCIGVNAKSQNPAAAVAFAAFLGNEENQVLRYEKSAQIPTNISAAATEAVQSSELAAVITAEANSCSVMQPLSTTFSARYWTYAGAIPTEIRSGEINKDNAQAKLDTFVAAMTAE